MLEVLGKHVEYQPDALAYTFLADGEEETDRRTYGELDRRARAIAQLLTERELQGERVLLAYPPGLEFIDAFLGCLYAGVVAVPAFPPTRGRGGHRLQAMAEDAEPKAALTTAAVLDRLAGRIERAPFLEGLDWRTTDGVPDELADRWAGREIDPDRLAFLQYTSGSTTTPRGVMVSHRNLAANEEVIRAGFGQSRDSVVVGWLPFHHDMGLIGNILQTLYVGARAVLMPPMAFLQRPRRWLDAISRYRATTSGGPDFAYDLCVRRIAPEERRGLDLGSWRLAFNGSETVRPETLERFAEAYGSHGFRSGAFRPCYGLAEATLMVSGAAGGEAPRILACDAAALETNRVAHAPAAGEGSKLLVGCGGLPEDHRVAVVDAESGRACGPDRVGELWVLGPSVAGGYWRRPEETRECFQATLDGEGPFLRTGDLGFLRDGQLFVTGRIKDLIIVRGRNHYPQDLELTAERVDDVLRPGCGAAFALDGDGEERVVVVQEVERASGADLEAVAKAVRRAVTSEHEIQVSEVVLCPRGSVPKTTSGKVQRSKCREKYESGEIRVLARSVRDSGDGASAGLDRIDLGDFPPAERRCVAEEHVRKLLGGILGVAPEELRRDVPIQAYGLDSIQAVEIRSAVEAAFGETVSLEPLLEGGSLERLVDAVLGVGETLACQESPLPDTPEERPVELRLAEVQKSLWVLYQLAPSIPVLNLPLVLKLQRPARPELLEEAFRLLAERHAVLRSTVFAPGGEPVQRIGPEPGVDFQVLDGAGGTEGERLRRILRECERPFDLESGPLFRGRLVSDEPGGQLLAFVIHHIAADGRSLRILLEELGALYSALESGREPSLEPPDLEYADFVRWQEALLRGPGAGPLWAFWARELAGELPVLELPADRKRPSSRSFRAGHQAVRIDGSKFEGLRRRAREEGLTVFMVLMSAYQVLLHRYSGQDDLIVGAPTSGRSRAALETVVGCLFNPVPVRVDLSGDPTLRALLRRVRRKVAAAVEHQDLPAHTMAERFQPARDSGRSHLFQTMLLFQSGWSFGEAGRGAGDGSALRVDVEGLHGSVVPLSKGAIASDLELELVDTGRGLTGGLQYSSDLFDPSTAARMARHFLAAVDAVVEAPECRVSEVSLLGRGERHQVVFEWGSGEELPVEGRGVHEAIAARAREVPERVAVVDGAVHVSYGELVRRSSEVAGRLRGRGVAPGEVVGLVVERSARLVWGALGVLEAGAAYLPVDPGQPAERTAKVLEDAGVERVVTEGAVAGLLSGLPGERLLLDEPEEVASGGVEAAAVRGGEAPAYVIYTSGTTGRPKGVVVSHRSLASYSAAASARYGLSGGDRALQFASFAFDASAEEVYPTLLAGATLVLRDAATAGSAEAFFERCRRWRVTVVNLPTAYWHELVTGVSEGRAQVPEGVRLVILGGEKALAEKVAGWREAVGERVRVVNTYGPTEATIVATGIEVIPGDGRGAEGEVPIGRPVPNAGARVGDAGGRPVPVGVAGELWIGGTGVARGYLGRPGRTAGSFVPDPYGGRPGARAYRSGDRVRHRPGGELEFLGRLDEQVKVRGYRIEPGEIESVLGEHPGVSEAVVVARESGPGDLRLVAYVVGEAEAEALRAFLGERLPGYMVPSAFVALDSLPRTVSGKVDRRALPAPEPLQGGSADGTAPRTEVEEIVAGICCDVLALERIGVHDDLFDLGCHSLLATRIVSRIREALHVDLPLPELFGHPTVAGLTERLQRSGDTGGAASRLPPIRPVPRDRGIPLSFAQERIWFLSRLDPANLAYNIPRALRIEGSFDVGVLERTMTELVHRHEILRTIFREEQGRPVQVVEAPAPFEVNVRDLQGVPAEERPERIEEEIREAGRDPFDLARGPLIRVKILQLAEQDFVLIMTEHHLVHDGWTQGVLVRDFLTVYDAFSRGRPSPLPTLPVQYADFAQWQRTQLTGALLDEQLAYWEEQLAGVPQLLDLPLDRPRPPVQSFRGESLTGWVPETLADELRRLSRREGATLFMTMLAGFVVLLHRYSGAEDLPVGSVIANRRVREVEGLLGMILNTVVLRTEVAGEPAFAEALGRVREVCLAAYDNQDFPFEKLVERLRPERHPSYNPLFQVMFAFMDTPMPALELPGMELRLLEAHNHSAKFDLSATLIPHAEQRVGDDPPVEAGGITVLWEYCSDLLDRSTATRMLTHYRRLLEAAVADPSCPISRLSFLGASEQWQVLGEWNDSGAAPEGPDSVLDAIARRVGDQPDAVAVIRGGEHLSFQELGRRSAGLARRLRALGAGPEVRVGVCLPRSPELVVTLLGVLRSGGVYVPMDPAHPAERLALVARDGGVDLVVGGSEAAAMARATGLAADVVDVASALAEEPDGADVGAGVDSGASPSALAYVLYTSGSTGTPKGVMVSHRSLASHCRAAARTYGTGPRSRVLQFAAPGFDPSLEQILTSLTRGAELVMVGREVPSLEGFWRLLAEARPTIVNLPPAYWHQLMARAPRVDGAGGSVEVLLVGGDEMRPESLGAWRTSPLRRARLLNVYGPTEATVTATAGEVGGKASEALWRVPVGRPLPGRRAYGIDGRMQAAGLGVPAELHLGGQGLARGYLGRPALTAERFVPDPFGTEAGGRLYRTGDLVRYLGDGALEFLGRVDQQVKLRGFRVEPGEIESVLGEHPGVSESVVVPRESPEAGPFLVAYTAGEAPPEALRSLLAERLPGYMVPSVFVPVDRLPLTANGKVDRSALPPPPDGPSATVEYMPPRDSVEETVAGVWQELLPVERVGVHDDFFELGGHSLLATQVISRLHEVYGVELPVKVLFEAPTVAQLAPRIADGRGPAEDDDVLRQALEAVEQMSDEEARALLQQQGVARDG